MQAFQHLGLDENLLRGIEELGYQTPTPVQELVIPTALTTSGDFIALAQTGTGKTAAFGLPLLQRIDPETPGVQALILCPTRELCVQVAGDLVNYSKHAHRYKVVAVYGGASINTQISEIKAGAQIVVATPGRLVDLVERRAINLAGVRRVVLDEADEMLNMGFKDELDAILGAAVNRETIWLFSATMPKEVLAIAQTYMRDPQELSVGRKNQANENIEHLYYVCRPHDRYAVLKRIVDALPGIYGLIFCRTKVEAKEIAEQMARDGYNSDALHGDLAQSERDRVMNRFREGTLQLLIATDVAARGIDVSNISHVIHYGLPDDIEVYTHRSGRTGRAGKTGVSIAIVPTKYEERIRHIEKALKIAIQKKQIPTGPEVCERQLMHIIKNIHDTEVQHAEIEPFLPQILDELKDLSREELIKRFASMEFNRFLSYYRNADDLNIYPRGFKKGDKEGKKDKGSKHSTGNYHRLFVSIGEMDGVTKKDFLNLLSQSFGIPKGVVGQIDLKPYYLHFDIEEGYAETARNELKTMIVNDRKVRVDDASAKKEKGEGFKKDGFKKEKKPFSFGPDKGKKKKKWKA